MFRSLTVRFSAVPVSHLHRPSAHAADAQICFSDNRSSARRSRRWTVYGREACLQRRQHQIYIFHSDVEQVVRGNVPALRCSPSQRAARLTAPHRRTPPHSNEWRASHQDVDGQAAHLVLVEESQPPHSPHAVHVHTLARCVVSLQAV